MTDKDSLPKSKKGPSDRYVLTFIVLLCFISALLLAVTSYSLQGQQNAAKEFDQSKQMLIAAKILNPLGYFEIVDQEGEAKRARLDEQKGVLVPDPNGPIASSEEIKRISDLRIRPLLIDEEGKSTTFEANNLDLVTYLTEHKKSGYAHLKEKLIYAILPNEEGLEKVSAEDVAKEPSKAPIYVVPISGFGLWSAIFGYLALMEDGDTVVGTTWYEHGETPGLGANITEPWWQKQFYGKVIFQEGAQGTTDFKTAPMGIIVVKGKVKDVFGTSPKAKSAVDGMSGATLTGDGVTAAYRDTLTPYRAFFIRLHEEKGAGNGKKASS